jgi:hypothetical protein
MTENDTGPLQLIGDSVSTIRRLWGSREDFLSRLSAPFLAVQLVSDLIITGYVPLSVDYVDGWSIVSSEKDWLVQPDGSVSLWNFHHVVHFPQVGREACRSEILLTAFADAVVTAYGQDAATWIVGSPDEYPFTLSVQERFRPHEYGRTVAIKLSDDFAGRSSKYQFKAAV